MYRRKHWTDTRRHSIQFHHFFLSASRLCFVLFNSHPFFANVSLNCEQISVFQSVLFSLKSVSIVKTDKVCRRTTFLLLLPLLPNEISLSNSWRLAMIITWMNEMNDWMNECEIRIAWVFHASRWIFNQQTTLYVSMAYIPFGFIKVSNCAHLLHVK